MEKFMGIDIGGTSVKIGIVDTAGVLEYKIKHATADLLESGDFIGQFARILEGEFTQHPEIVKVGIGLPGTLTKDRRHLIELPNIPMLNGVALRDILDTRFPGYSFRLENDANAAALGEYYFSGTEMPENYIFVTLGTGVGGAAIIDHDIFTGGDGNSMELGHTMSRGNRTLEENIGKKGILALAFKLMAGRTSSLHQIPDLDPKKIIAAAVDGDPVAIEVYVQVGELLGEALVSTVRLLDIKAILIGGGLATGFDLLRQPLIEVLTAKLTPYYTAQLSVHKAQLGNNAGIIGAAALCFK
jgi:glucokinase